MRYLHLDLIIIFWMQCPIWIYLFKFEWKLEPLFSKNDQISDARKNDQIVLHHIICGCANEMLKLFVYDTIM